MHRAPTGLYALMNSPSESLIEEYIRYFSTADQYDAARLQIELWHHAGRKNPEAAGRFVSFWFDSIESEATRLTIEEGVEEPQSIRKTLEIHPETLQSLRKELALILPLLGNPTPREVLGGLRPL